MKMIFYFSVLVLILEFSRLGLIRFLMIPVFDHKIAVNRNNELQYNNLILVRDFYSGQLGQIEIFKRLYAMFLCYVGGYYCSFVFGKDPFYKFDGQVFFLDFFKTFFLIIILEAVKFRVFEEPLRTLQVRLASIVIFVLLICIAYWSNSNLLTIVSLSVALLETTDYIYHLVD